MTKANTLYQIDESTPKNPYLLEKVKEAGSLRKLAKLIEINPAMISFALNNKEISTSAKIKIAKYFDKDSAEIF